MPRPSLAFASPAILLLTGCTTTPSVAAWHEARDPATLGEATLSMFDDTGRSSACSWIQLDPIGGSRRALVTMESECIDPRVVISPDGRSAAVSQSDPAAGIFEVSLVTGSWRKLPPATATIERLFWREGVLYLIAGGTFRSDGRSWIRSEEPWPDKEILNRLDSTAVIAVAAGGDLPHPSAKLVPLLEKKYGEGPYREITPNAFIRWFDDQVDGPLLLLHPDGALQAAPVGDSSGILYTALETRGRWLLMTDAGSNPLMFDLTTGAVVYQSQEVSSVTFWPRLSAASDTIEIQNRSRPLRPWDKGVAIP